MRWRRRNRETHATAHNTQEQTGTRYAYRMREKKRAGRRDEKRHRPVLRVERRGDDTDETMRKASRQRLIAQDEKLIIADEIGQGMFFSCRYRIIDELDIIHDIFRHIW